MLAFGPIDSDGNWFDAARPDYWRKGCRSCHLNPVPPALKLERDR